MSIYDIIAKIAVFLHETNDEYNIVSDYCCGKCVEQLPFDIDVDTKVGYSSLALCDDFEWLDIKVEQLIQKKEYFHLARILQELDTKIGLSDYDYYDEEDEDDVFQPLNTHLLEKAYIWPKLDRCTKWKHSNDELSESVNKLLRNVLVVYKYDLCEYRIVNHYVKMDKFKKDFLVIGSPVSDKTQVNWNPTIVDYVNKMTFEVKYDNNEAFVNSVIEMIEKAEREKADFLAFPELISNYDLNNEIIKKIRKIDFKFLKFIALPTYYDVEKHINVGDVYYIKENRVLFSQNKTFPYIKYKNQKSETDVKEMIEKNNEIHILHINGIGRIVFPICKDVLVDKYMKLCRGIKANLIIVRSFSPGEYSYRYFLRLIRGYTSFECSGFWINSCSYKLNSENSNSQKVICVTAKSKCDENEDTETSNIYHCQSDCNNCMFRMSIN